MLASKFYMGMPNSLGNSAWGCRIPYYIGGANIPEGVPISLGNFAWGCQILGGAKSPMTPVPVPVLASYPARRLEGRPGPRGKGRLGTILVWLGPDP